MSETMTNRREAAACRRLGLKPEELHILTHALGVGGRGKPGGWRNHYVAYDGTDSWVPCRLLAIGGWLRESRQVDGSVFRVSQAGIAALKLCGFKLLPEKRSAPAKAT